MKRLILALLCLGAVLGGSASLPPYHSDTDELAAFHCTNRRPFSWYYPETYQYYYPKHRRAAYWNYTNGTYVYTNK